MRGDAGVVLTRGSYYGTLAAVRCLGRSGVRVTVADAERFAPASWSRHARSRERCPPVRPIGPFIDWLLEYGKRNPGEVLYAACDDLAWAFAERREELGEVYRLLTPAFDDVATLLDKGALHAACGAAGLTAPATWFPSLDDLNSVAEQVTFPAIIKPRTQVRFSTMRKGSIVRSR